ncbi:MAG: hypothetical protein A2161_04920 [Candidatus Schekmanbacteria bacterium RBG_13_48_7]|uniref:Uncharacterized protein n=1 Tax=Candidatus Schekmanbacteria bacterium RBG_13_48_7 TaxID=1817878 RepID=A0A1F7RNI0_9BACT|nr:MAG: hypothetical protein A2161_04920 [Candidatus Schekmanbacteria bacterium RBG_13_48_7]
MHNMETWMEKAPKIIDMGADFRLRAVEDWKYWYKNEHTASHLIEKFVYGVPELYREQIQKADYIAGPGCEAIVSILSLYPFVKHGLIKKDLISHQNAQYYQFFNENNFLYYNFNLHEERRS